jgi:hypothetical protein
LKPSVCHRAEDRPWMSHALFDREGGIADFIKRYGIERPQRAAARRSCAAENYARLLAIFLSELATGEPSDVVLRDLNCCTRASCRVGGPRLMGRALFAVQVVA